MHLEVRHKNLIARFPQEVSNKCVMEVFFISCLSGKAISRNRRRRECVFCLFVFFVQSVWMCVKYGGELSLRSRFILVFLAGLFTLTYFDTGYPIGADITATWILHINHVSFTISGFKRRAESWEGLKRLVASSFTFLSACFLPLWLHCWLDNPC